MISCLRFSALALACGLSIGMAGCAGSPPAQFYTLAPLTAAGEAPQQQTAFQSRSVSVSQISLPEFIDRPQLVLTLDENRVRLLENHRWAEPLKSAIPRILAENLSRLLGTDRVSWYPQNAAYHADYRVLADVQRFEASSDQVIVDTLWTVRSGGTAPAKTGRSRIREQIQGSGYEAVAAAYSRALAAVSTEIAAAISKESNK